MQPIPPTPATPRNATNATMDTAATALGTRICSGYSGRRGPTPAVGRRGETYHRAGHAAARTRAWSAAKLAAAAAMARAAIASATIGTHIATRTSQCWETSPSTHDAGAVPNMCMVKITSPCAATLRPGGARSSTVAAIGAWYQVMKNSVATTAAYIARPLGSTIDRLAIGIVSVMPRAM